MAKDLIIGGASGYKYADIKYWINSIKKSGFEGDIVLVVTNISMDELEKIAEKGVNILAYGQKDESGYSTNSKTPPHVERFFHIWNFLNTSTEHYRYVITTDVRDVVFQKNPILYLEEAMKHSDLVAAGEGLKYKDEPWGNNNYMQAFGPFFHEKMKDNEIYNVGVIAGKYNVVTDLMLMLLQLSVNRPIPIVDQAVYNFILNLKTFYVETHRTSNDGNWAVNLGTTLPAIASGSGDIGQRNDPTSQLLYQAKYLCNQPVIQDDTVKNSQNEEFVIVHQYDRVAGLADKIRAKYDD